MKIYHFLQNTLTKTMVFLYSQSGSMFVLAVVFMFDLWTNHLGIELMFEQRLENQGHAAASSGAAFWFATAFSLLGSMMLGMGVMQATFHDRRGSQWLIGGFSAIISLMGMEYGFYNGREIVLVTMVDWLELLSMQVMFLALAISPQKVYADTASLIIEKFGDALESYSVAANQQMQRSITGQTLILGELDLNRLKQEAQDNGIKLEKLGLEGDTSESPRKPRAVELSDISIEDFLNS